MYGFDDGAVISSILLVSQEVKNQLVRDPNSVGLS